MKKYIIPISLAFLLFSCSKPKEDETKVQEIHILSLSKEEIKTAKIEFVTPETKMVPEKIKVTGLLDVPPQNLITISIPIGGIVKKTDLMEGSKVTKGMTLVTLEHPDYIQIQQDYLEILAKLELSALELNRQKTLTESQISGGKQLEIIKNEIKLLEIKKSSLAAKLKMIYIDPIALAKGTIFKEINIPSTLNGFVQSVKVNPGKYVQPQEVIIEIIDNSHLHCELKVFEKDIMKIKEGDEILFEMVNGDKIVRKASVYLKGKVIDPDKTVRIHGHLEKEDPELIPGMFVTATISSRATSAWKLPLESVVFNNNQYLIFTTTDEKNFEIVKVNLINQDKQFSYFSVDNENDIKDKKIVSKGTFQLMSKAFNTSDE